MKRLIHNWDEKAADWHRHIGSEGDGNRRFNIDPVIWNMMGDVHGKTVLDAGCGTGYLAIKLARRGAVVTGVDWSSSMIDVAKKQAESRGLHIDLRVDDCLTLATLSSATFDILVNHYVLQDLPDLASAVASFRRVVRPGGLAVVVIGHPCFNPPGGASFTGDEAIYRWADSYFDEWEATERWSGRDGQTGETFEFASDFVFFHRPLSTYWRTFRSAGFEVAAFEEPVVKRPYPADLDEERARRYRMCPYSVVFGLRASE